MLIVSDILIISLFFYIYFNHMLFFLTVAICLFVFCDQLFDKKQLYFTIILH